MIKQEKPALPCADAGPVSAAFSENPMLHHARSGKTGHQLATSRWTHRLADAVCHHSPVHSAHRTLRP